MIVSTVSSQGLGHFHTITALCAPETSVTVSRLAMKQSRITESCAIGVSGRLPAKVMNAQKGTGFESGVPVMCAGVSGPQLALLETTAAVVSYITWLCMVMSPACSLHRAYQCACDLIVQRQICILCAAGRHFAAGLAGGGTRQGVRLRMLDSRSQGSYLSWSKHDMLCCVQESVSSLEPRRRHPAALQQEADAARMPELARWVVAPALCLPNSSRFGRLARCAETGGFCRASIPTLPLRCSQVMLCRLICQPWHCYLHKAQPHKRRSCGLLQALRVGL